MRVPVSWLREYAALPADLPARQLADGLVRLGLEVDSVEPVGTDISGPVVVGRVLDFSESTASNGKTIRWCTVDTGGAEPRGVVCGARNFEVGDAVVVALPGAVLPGGFAIAARRTYGRLSDGMICAADEIGLGDDHAGILVLPPDAPVGADAVAYLGLRDDVLDVSATPDRGYALSVRGLAREASHAFGVAFTDPADPPVPAGDGSADASDAGWPVTLADPSGCDRFSTLLVSGMDPAAPSPLLVRRRLLLAGLRPISLAVDATNYVMLETGQPLHAWDAARLTGPLQVRRARAGERLRTLDGVERRLDPDDMVVADADGPLNLGGIMGGASTEIGPATADVLLEAAHWDPGSTSRAGRRHRLPSEAARRFERGVDPEVASPALRRCAELLVRYGGARVDGGVAAIGPGPSRGTITLRADAPARVAGMPVPPEVTARRLVEVGCTVGTATGPDGAVAPDAMLAVLPPSWRPDLNDPADLVEEVVRLQGYEGIPSELPTPPPGRGLTAAQHARRSVGRTLAEAGYVEVLSYPFVSAAVHDAFGLAEDDPRRHAVRLANPLSDAEPELRTSLLPGLLAALRRNVGRGLLDLALYEMGLVFLPRPDAGPAPVPGVAGPPSAAELAALDAALPEQPRHVAVALCGDREQAGWWGGGRAASWGDTVEAARRVAAELHAGLDVRQAVLPPWHPGRCAALLHDGRVVGHAGELDPRVAAALELPRRTCVAEFDLDALGVPGVVTAPRPSTYPPALLDVALVVPTVVPAAEVESALRDGVGPLLESLRLFDVYADPERLGPDRRSLAYALRLRAPDRTLTAQDAAVARDGAVAEASRRTGAVLRG